MTKLKHSPRIAVAGGVGSSRRTLEGLLRHRANVVGVLGLSAESARNVSGYKRMDDLARTARIPYKEFGSINSQTVLDVVSAWHPDLLFVVGLSQLVGPDLLAIASLGCIGFHPTCLPEGRGRAPIAWLVLDRRPGAATFFLMDEGTDSGPILAQAPFVVGDDDYAADVIQKVHAAIDVALDSWLPRLLAGEWNPRPQNDSEATYRGRRYPEDGLIDWEWSAEHILAVVRAVGCPYPGAYTYYRGRKLIVRRAELQPHPRHRGVVGRILLIDDGTPVVQTGDGVLRITEVAWEGSDADAKPVLRVNTMLGYSAQDEIHALRTRMRHLEERLDQIEKRTGVDH